MSINTNKEGITLMDESGNSVQYARLQMRGGNEDDFDPSKMLPREFAVMTDTEKLHIAFAPGKTKQLMTVDDALEEVQEKADEILASLPEDYTELSKDFSSLSNDISYLSRIKNVVSNETEVITDKYINSSGEEISSTNWCVFLYEFYEKNFILYSGLTTVGSTTCLCFFSGEELLKSYKIVSSDYSEKIEIPLGANKIKMSVNKSDINNIHVAIYKEITDSIKTNVGAINQDGTPNPGNTAYDYSNMIFMEDLDKIIITGTYGKDDFTVPVVATYMTLNSNAIYTIKPALQKSFYENPYIIELSSLPGRYARVCLRNGVNYPYTITLVKKDLEIINARKIRFSNSNLLGVNFKKNNSPIIDIPDGETDIGLMSVMDMRNIPIKNKLDNIYMWASPHDAGEDGVTGGIYLWTANAPDGEWTYRGVVMSTKDFNDNYLCEAQHISSPDVVWDETIKLDEQQGCFRIYYHANLGDARDGFLGQRTFLALSKDGTSVNKFVTESIDNPVIPIPKNGDIDFGTSDYARFIRCGNKRWASIFSASTETGPVGIGFTISDDNGYTFKKTMKDFLIAGVIEDDLNIFYAGLPSYIMKKDVMYISFFSYGSGGGTTTEYYPDRGIYLAELHEDGSVVHRGCILSSSDNESDWDSLRVCASYLFEYENNLYLFYSGRPVYNSDGEKNTQGSWPGTRIGIAKCMDVRW